MAETDAIALRVTPYGEADLIVTLLAAEGGKVRGIARAARRSRKRFGAGLDPGNRGILSHHTQGRSELVTVDGFAGSRPPALGPDPVTARTRPPPVTRRPSASAPTPAQKTVAPVASAAARPSMTSPVRGAAG